MPASRKCDDLVLGDAARPVHALQPVADQEHRVADDRARQRDLEHDQARRPCVPAQRREDGEEVHGVLSAT